MGTMIQRHGLTEDKHNGNNEYLNITHPEIIKGIHKEYIGAGADIIETNTFSANRISQAEYGCSDSVAQMAFEGARIAREAADEAAENGRKVWVAGSMGPTSKSLSISPDASSPSYRPYSFEMMYEAYHEQAQALVEGGVDLLLLETCFDALNAKAALAAIEDISSTSGRETPIPVIVSVSVGDRSGRTLTGQTLKAFYTAIRHYPIKAFGLNCSLGAAEMMPLLEDIDNWCDCAVICYPNAGLPDEMGRYDQSPETMAGLIADMAAKGLINITGGCCGTTPEHIKAIADAVRGHTAREHSIRHESGTLTISGLEAVTFDLKRNNITNIGERTNVAGSRRFARLIAEKEYEEALRIAAKQIEDGAAVIDINMDDSMLDCTGEMETFVRHISNDPDVAKAALMIDSSHWETIIAGLRNAQGKCIVNSISLKDGEQSFIEKAIKIHSLGAAMIVMAFDEKGQATTFDRKIEICARAYRLLTEKARIQPEDIIFDVNVLSIGTGMEEDARYACDFIEAVRWIKTNLPGALTSGGISNLSFAFRGNNTVREAMHSVFLYHAVRAGLDMAILNPSMLQIYDEIEPDLRKCVEDVIFDADPHATERLLEKAAAIIRDKTNTESHIQSQHNGKDISVQERLKNAIIKGRTEDLENDIPEALKVCGTASAVIEGPLMDGMDSVGRMFGEGKMFLPQVVKSAKVMRDAVSLLEPYMDRGAEGETGGKRPSVVIATVKGDVHDIGKNITATVLNCNGFEVKDLGVMVEKEKILEEAHKSGAEIIALSGLITPSLHQMEEICREMHERGMKTPLFVGGATTSALHTAVKLAPLYNHVYHGADASSCAVMAQRYIADPDGFEEEMHQKQEELRNMYRLRKPHSGNSDSASPEFPEDSYMSECPDNMLSFTADIKEILPFFDWRMFYAIWGVRYGGPVPEAMELMQLRKDAEDELEAGNFRIMMTAAFLPAYREGNDIVFADGETGRIPMLREEDGRKLSLCDFISDNDSGKTSPVGLFAISVSKGDTHQEGCCCPACSNRYEDLIGKTVRMTLAEACSTWLDSKISRPSRMKLIKPAIGYASCPDHSMKRDIFRILDRMNGVKTDTDIHAAGIRLTETCAMTPEASICGMIFMHEEATYPDIRHISDRQFSDYVERRGMSEEDANLFLGHLK